MSKTIQTWPNGQVLEWNDERGEVRDPHGQLQWRYPTAEEKRARAIEERAELYSSREIWCCDSMLVDAALALGGEGDLGEAFSYENVKNLRPDSSNWTLEQCREWLKDNGHDLPDPDPWSMQPADLIELLVFSGLFGEDEDHSADALTDLIEAAVDEINTESYEGLDEWRDAVSDEAEDAEIYEWWRVSEWLARRLEAVGECVLDNDYGTWWGRTCTGQSYMMDGVLQKIAANHVS